MVKKTGNTITVASDGPLILKGELDIQGAPEEAPEQESKAFLCRCGLSKNKPYCDGSHGKADFNDPGAIANTGQALTETGGPLKVTFSENGPIRIAGNVCMVSGSGDNSWEGTRTALCRCGLSQNKPFCDGAHRGSDWRSD